MGLYIYFTNKEKTRKVYFIKKKKLYRNIHIMIIITIIIDNIANMQIASKYKTNYIIYFTIIKLNYIQIITI